MAALIFAASMGDAIGVHNALSRAFVVDGADAALEAAAERGHLECVRLLLEAGTQPAHEALLLSIERGHLDCTALLLFHGAAPSAYALDRAIHNGPNVAALALLLHFGAEPTATHIADYAAY